MKARALQGGQATAEWLVTLALVGALAVLGHRLLFEPLRSVYRWAADCVTVGECEAFDASRGQSQR